MDIQKRQDQRHTHIDAVLYLTEICGAGIVVYLYGDFVDPGKGMEHIHILGRQLHFLAVQDIKILHPNVILFIEEAFLLNSGHVQDIQFRKRVLQTDHLFIRDLLSVQVQRAAEADLATGPVSQVCDYLSDWKLKSGCAWR